MGEGIKPIDWTGAWTFEHYVISLFEQNKIESLEFQTLKRIYGAEKLRAIWRKWRQKNGKDDPGESSDSLWNETTSQQSNRGDG